MTGDDDEPCLCPSTLAALQEFYAEKEEREKLQKCSNSSEVLFDENWVNKFTKYSNINIYIVILGL